MRIFATIRVEEIKARELVEQLVIDGVRQLESFEDSLAGSPYLSEFRVLIKYIEYLADGNSLPESKFRHLKGAKDGIAEHEFKSKHLRIYAIQLPSRKIIIFGGHKKNQEADISKFRSTKALFLESLKIKKNEKK
ncbi:MAG: hypothetical protein JST42_04085 [Bacteroidetes bacterium]|nr:hypothetical protein [Bacteroidota bacterium]